MTTRFYAHNQLVLIKQTANNVTRIRWFVQPDLGLPLGPFTVWALREDIEQAGPLRDRAVVNNGSWTPLERVGLPIDDNDPQGWTGYDAAAGQGMAPLFPSSPREAATNRLQIARQNVGWATTIDTIALPPWEEPNYDRLLDHLNDQHSILGGLKKWLVDKADHSRRHNSNLKDQDGNFHSGEIHFSPLISLHLGVNSDPIMAYALGFGTAYPQDDSVLGYMVSARFKQHVSLRGMDIELPEREIANFWLKSRKDSASHYSDLRWIGLYHEPTIHRLSINQPERHDEPYTETIGVHFQELGLNVPHQDPIDTPNRTPGVGYEGDMLRLVAASYAAVCIGPNSDTVTTLLKPYYETSLPGGVSVSSVGGLVPVLPAKATSFPYEKDVYAPVIARARLMVPETGENLYRFTVASQDIFGNWNAWQPLASYPAKPLPAQQATILAVELIDSNTLWIDFVWDWTVRSAEWVRFSSVIYDPSLAEPPMSNQFQTAYPNADGTDIKIETFTSHDTDTWSLKEIDLENPQSLIKRYRLIVNNIRIAFDKVSPVTLCIHCNSLEAVRSEYAADPTASAPPAVYELTIYNPDGPPAMSHLPEDVHYPEFASLPDFAGRSHINLSWNSPDARLRYNIYEATERDLLKGDVSIDEDLGKRMNAITQLPALNQAVFHKLNKEAQKQTTFEYALPKGSRVIHTFVVTAVNESNKESPFPDPGSLRAFAIPKLVTPMRPSIRISYPQASGSDHEAQHPQITIQFPSFNGPALSHVEIYRFHTSPVSKMATDDEFIGPAMPSVEVEPNRQEPLIVTDKSFQPSWFRTCYRAALWAKDEPGKALKGGPSELSSIASIFVPPDSPPTITEDLKIAGTKSGAPRVDTKQAVMVTWTMDAPRAPTEIGSFYLSVFVLDYPPVPAGRSSDPDFMPLLLETIPSQSVETFIPSEADTVQVIFDPEQNRYFAWARRTERAQQITVQIMDPLRRTSQSSLVLQSYLSGLWPADLHNLQLVKQGIDSILVSWTSSSPRQKTHKGDYRIYELAVTLGNSRQVNVSKMPLNSDSISFVPNEQDIKELGNSDAGEVDMAALSFADNMKTYYAWCKMPAPYLKGDDANTYVISLGLQSPMGDIQNADDLQLQPSPIITDVRSLGASGDAEGPGMPALEWYYYQFTLSRYMRPSIWAVSSILVTYPTSIPPSKFLPNGPTIGLAKTFERSLSAGVEVDSSWTPREIRPVREGIFLMVAMADPKQNNFNDIVMVVGFAVPAETKTIDMALKCPPIGHLLISKVRY